MTWMDAMLAVQKNVQPRSGFTTQGDASFRQHSIGIGSNIASMSVSEFQRWNPHFTKSESERKIADAKMKASNSKGNK